jgi:acetylornithine deacetylase/succinyl-diaminopimelate desuccinylase-like protein
VIDWERVDQVIINRLDDSLSELNRLCAQPSIAAQGLGMQACAEMVGEMLRARGLDVQLITTGGYPVVYGERRGRSNRTLLFYNHYDVQPPEPLALWQSPPFEPTRRDGKLFARGVSDDKGHIVCRLAALDALLAVLGELPCNVKFVIEGEEEISSPNLPSFVADHRELLTADACIWEFGRVNEAGVPLQYAGQRGICYVELNVATASKDVHSGIGGSIFPNAAWRLVWALQTIKGRDGRIRLPGFYEAVRPASARDWELLTALPEVADELRDGYGVQRFVNGLTGGAELRHAQVFLPTCTICGLTSGYQGTGSKTVLPARASAKIDFRLVPDQTPEAVLSQLRAHLDAEGFDDVEVTFLGGEPPARTDPDHPFLQLVSAAARDVYGVPQLITPLSGGSGPMHLFMHTLGVPIATAGVSYPGAQTHSPNEHILIDHFEKGIRHTARIMSDFGAQRPLPA